VNVLRLYTAKTEKHLIIQHDNRIGV